MPRRMAYRGERRVGAGGALWRYTGALGKAWRVYVQERGAQVPGQVRDLHARLLLALRDVLLPHLGHGDEVCILDFCWLSGMCRSRTSGMATRCAASGASWPVLPGLPGTNQ